MKIAKTALSLGLLALMGAMTFAPMTASAADWHHHRHHMVKKYVWRHHHRVAIWVRV